MSPSIQGQQNVPAPQQTLNLPPAATGQSLVIEDEANIGTDAVLIDLSESVNETFKKEVKN